MNEFFTINKYRSQNMFHKAITLPKSQREPYGNEFIKKMRKTPCANMSVGPCPK